MNPFFDNIEKIKQVRSSVLVIHGDADEIVPFSMGETIYNAAPAKKQTIHAHQRGGAGVLGVCWSIYK